MDLERERLRRYSSISKGDEVTTHEGKKLEAAISMRGILGNVNQLIMSVELQERTIGKRLRTKLLSLRKVATEVVAAWEELK